MKLVFALALSMAAIAARAQGCKAICALESPNCCTCVCGADPGGSDVEHELWLLCIGQCSTCLGNGGGSSCAP